MFSETLESGHFSASLWFLGLPRILLQSEAQQQQRDFYNNTPTKQLIQDWSSAPRNRLLKTLFAPFSGLRDDDMEKRETGQWPCRRTMQDDVDFYLF